jgi:hypothetical protein
LTRCNTDGRKKVQSNRIRKSKTDVRNAYPLYGTEEFKKIQQEEQGLGSGKEYEKADKKPIKADKSWI